MQKIRTLFDVIAKVTSRTERFHSETLTWFLQDSHEFRRRLVVASVPEEFRRTYNLETPGLTPFVCAEDSLSTGERVDITIRWQTAVVGIEVKTVDSSSTDGQLESYWNGLFKKYGCPVYILYLTPFNQENIPDSLSQDRLHAVREFSRFKDNHPGSGTHLNWSQLSSLYPFEETDSELGFCMRQHRDYLMRVVCNAGTMAQLDKTRGLGVFLGDGTVREFFGRLKAGGVSIEEDQEGYQIELDSHREKYEEIVEAIVVLLESEEVAQQHRRKDKISPPVLKNEYEDGDHGSFFRRLFEEVDARPYAWLRGNTV